METIKLISGNTEQEIWNQIEADLQSDSDLLQYQAEIQHAGKRIILDIDIDLGGGFEGGFELTTLSAALSGVSDFRFALHHEEFLDEIGKFFGIQDLITGYAEFDKNVVVKTNDIEKLKTIFSDSSLREVVQSLEVFQFYTETENEQRNLILKIEEGITDPERLRQIYNVFYKVLGQLI